MSKSILLDFTSGDDGLESVICLLHVESQISSLLLGQLLAGLHLVQGYQPLDDFASMLEILVGTFVYRLDHVGEERM